LVEDQFSRAALVVLVETQHIIEAAGDRVKRTTRLDGLPGQMQDVIAPVVRRRGGAD
jgi:hypothetical protein